MLPAYVTPRAGLNRDDDYAVDDRLSFLRGAYRLLVIHAADRVAAVGDHDQNLSSFSRGECLGAEIESVVESGSRSQTNVVNATVDRLEVGSERYHLADHFAETVERERVHGAQDGMGEAAGRREFQRQILTRAQAGVDVDNDGQRQGRFFVKHRNGLWFAIF